MCIIPGLLVHGALLEKGSTSLFVLEKSNYLYKMRERNLKVKTIFQKITNNLTCAIDNVVIM